MTRRFKIEPGRVWGDKDGVTFFDTDAYPLQYANTVLTVSGYTLTFPDLRKANAYNWQQWDGSGGNPRESAISVITMANQEWGPASANPTDAGTQLDDVVLGAVPAGADHILVRVKASRTTSPSQINGNTIPPELEPGQWTIAYGGTLLFEQLFPLARMIYVYLAPTDNGDGTRNVMLRRLQSVTKRRQAFYRSGNDYNKTGWNYGGTYGSVYGIPVAQRDTRAANTDVTGVGGRYRRTGSSPAATNDNTNYSSVYSVDFEIIPGRADIAPDSGSGGTSAYFGLADEQVSEATASTHTVAINFGDADATRKIIVGVTAFNSTASGRDISSVTIGGVTATQVAYRKVTNGSLVTLAGIYIASVPTGDSGNVVVAMSGGTTLGCTVTAFAGYHMNSATPDATISSPTANSNTSLATVNGGLAVAIGTEYPAYYDNIEYAQTPFENFWIQGMSNPALWDSRPNVVNSQAYSRNFDLTDGATLTLRYNYTGGTPSLCSWVAASFH